MEGRIFWDPTFPEIEKSERHKYYAAMNETLAALHKVDYKKIGLGDYGKEGQFVERQIKMWARQYLSDEDAGRIASMDKLVEWLPQNIPENDETTIAHGDFRCDNMIFHPTEPRVIAVLDWELSTLGNPLADFTYHLMTYSTSKRPAYWNGRHRFNRTRLAIRKRIYRPILQTNWARKNR